MSGADGALVGEAIMSDGDVLALAIEHRDARDVATRRSPCSPQPQPASSAEPASRLRVASLSTARAG